MDSAQLLQTSLMVVVVMLMVGIVFGLVLATANKYIAVKVNPIIKEIEEILPKGQCGACGYPGCNGYAEAVVNDPNVPPNMCIPGKAEVANFIAEVTGKKAEPTAPQIAVLMCAGTAEVAINKAEYHGVKDCNAANLLGGGAKGCGYGCLGFGSCVKVCTFGAIKMGANGLPEIDKKLCTGCGNCGKACPKKIIKMLPANLKVAVHCSSRDKGAVSRKLCQVSCIGCGICARACPYGAIIVENNLAIINYEKCSESCTDKPCLPKCPTGAIKAFGLKS